MTAASPFGKRVAPIVLMNPGGMKVTINPVGATIQRLEVPDKDGNSADVVLGYDDPELYATVEPTPYFGSVVGRVSNRIEGAKFFLQRQSSEHRLTANNGPNCLHGGANGFNRKLFDAKKDFTPQFEAVNLSYTSPDGEEGFPGELKVKVRYELPKNANELRVFISATTDKSTPVSIAQHSYFNLAGHNSGSSILDHVIKIHGDHYTPVDDALIPTGEILPVAGTPFDFSEEKAIGASLPEGGYDHNYVLFGLGEKARFVVVKGVAFAKPRLAASVHDPKSGRAMDVLTTAPGMQFYTGNFLDGSGPAGKGGAVYNRHGGFCLETQAFPNAVNMTTTFPTPVIGPQDTYKHDMVYKFYTKE